MIHRFADCMYEAVAKSSKIWLFYAVFPMLRCVGRVWDRIALVDNVMIGFA